MHAKSTCNELVERPEVALLLTCKDITVEYPTVLALDQVTAGISSGNRIGIVGENGTGKSTLLRVIAGTQEPDAGEVLLTGSSTIGMLTQTDGFADDDTIEAILEQGNEAGAAYTWKSDARARSIVDVLLAGIDLATTVGKLSGGQRRRLDLARLLIGDWDILLLDEPTNHLDVSTIHWLADHLKSRWPQGTGALVVVTHDRWFLDEVCTVIWELHEGHIHAFEGGYSAYIMQRVERARLQDLAARKRENQLRKELAWLSRGAQARRRKPKFHVEAAQALINDVPPMRDTIALESVAVARLGKQVFELNDVCIDRNDTRIIRGLTWTIGPGERIGILGRNGAGKSTLLALFQSALRPTLGHMKVGRTVRVAALTQNLDELAPFEDDVVRVLCSRYKTYYVVDGHKLSPTKLLERLGFSRDALQARVKDLSGGQRRRLQLLLTLLEEPNVLILDEPGNDLDIDMLAATEDLLDSWPGTLIVVSHDRHFLERTTDNLYAILDGTVRHIPRGVDEYLEAEAALDAQSKQPGPSSDATPPAKTSSNAQRHQLRKQLSSIERRIATQQERLREAQEALNQTDPYDYEALGTAQSTIQEHEAALDALEMEWLELSEELGSM